MAVVAKQPQTYQYYFDRVLTKRLYYVNNISILAAIFASITLNLPYGAFWRNLLFTFVARAPVIYLALLLVKQARRKFSTVEFTPYKTFNQQLFHSVFSTKFCKSAVFYILSAYFVHLVFIFQLPLRSQYYVLSKEYRQKPLINDEWVYYWVFPLVLATIYTVIHVVFQRNLLAFKYGVNRTSPDENLLLKSPQLIINSFLLSVVVSIVSPVIYLFIRPIIYRANFLIILLLGLDSGVPSYAVSFGVLANLTYVSFHILLLWEIVNHTFGVYATIGCLDGKKPISTYSSDPINTLLSGLRNVDPEQQLCRLTAFQELAYIATSTDVEGLKLRSAVYNARSKSGYLWPSILNECSLVVKETTARINYRIPSDLTVLKEMTRNDSKGDFSRHDDSEIFGNSFATAHSTSATNSAKIPHYSQAVATNSSTNKWIQLFQTQIATPIKSILVAALDITPKSTSPTSLSQFQMVVRDFLQTVDYYNNKFLSSNFGVFFRITLKRDTESRVLNPVNFGNSIIALCNLLLHSLDEDKNFSILNDRNIREILELLEKPIRSTNNYIDYLPHSVYIPASKRSNKKYLTNHLVTLLHDLTMNEFYKICIKFNHKLNDLTLNARTFKLAKWVVDVAIAQQQTSTRENFR